MTLRNEFIDSLLPKDKNKAETLKTVLNNTCNDPTISAKLFLDVIAPTLKHIYPILLAHDLVGVQAITKPEDTVKTLRVGMTEETGRMAIDIQTVEVEATAKAFGVKYKESYGVEHMAAFSQELACEYDNELLVMLKRIAGMPTSTFAMDQVTTTGPVSFVGDVHAALAILINRQCNLIAARTRRGAGNWAVVSPTALTILQSATTSAFARCTDGFSPACGSKHVGTLNNYLNIYVDVYAPDDTPVLIGYKSEQKDGPVIFAPFMPLMVSNHGIVSRMNAYHELQNTTTSLGNASDYLGLVAIDTKSLTFL